MPTYTFPVQVLLDQPFPDAEAERQFCVQIEVAIEAAVDVTLVVALQPIRGVHRHTSTLPEAGS